MDIKTRFFLLLALFLGGHSQFAIGGGNASTDNLPYDFGEMRLMSDSNRMTARYEEAGKCLVIDGVVADCEYRDWNGIRYVVFEDKVVRIEASREFLEKKARLPFGLAVGEDRASVLKKLLRYRSVAGLDALLTSLKSGEKKVSVAVEDNRPGGEGYLFYLVFDDHDDLWIVGSMVTVI